MTVAQGTPRTDAEHATSPDNGAVPATCYGRMVALSRQLEREVVELQQQIDIKNTLLGEQAVALVKLGWADLKNRFGDSTVTRASVPPSVSDGGMPTDSAFVIRSPGKQDYNITFHNDGSAIGRLDFNGPIMTFTGDADGSAKVFFNYLAECFQQRLQEEREAATRTASPLAENE